MDRSFSAAVPAFPIASTADEARYDNSDHGVSHPVLVHHGDSVEVKDYVGNLTVQTNNFLLTQLRSSGVDVTAAMEEALLHRPKTPAELRAAMLLSCPWYRNKVIVVEKTYGWKRYPCATLCVAMPYHPRALFSAPTTRVKPIILGRVLTRKRILVRANRSLVFLLINRCECLFFIRCELLLCLCNYCLHMKQHQPSFLPSPDERRGQAVSWVVVL